MMRSPNQEAPPFDEGPQTIREALDWALEQICETTTQEADIRATGRFVSDAWWIYGCRLLEVWADEHYQYLSEKCSDHPETDGRYRSQFQAVILEFAARLDTLRGQYDSEVEAEYAKYGYKRNI